MIYFDNAATGGRKPDSVLTAVNASIRVCANPGRSGHKLSLACAKLVQDCRNALNEYFNGCGYERVIFTKNCTEALNIAIFGTLKQGDHVVATCLEHNSVLRPLEYLQKQGIIRYDVCGLRGDPRDNAELCLTQLKNLLRPNTRMVVITAASNVTGYTPPLKQIRELLSENTLLLCDGAQGCGHIPIDMQEIGIDLLAVAGHKGMHGIQGSGALLFSNRVQPSPYAFGGTGSMSISLDMPDFYPDRLEAGTLSFPAIVSLLEGVRYLKIHGEKAQIRLKLLSCYLINGLRRLDGYVIYSAPNPCGIVAFKHKLLQAELIAERLSSEFDIAVRGGLHCAPLAHEALGTLDGGLVRVSLSHFNSEREIESLLSALKTIQNR